MGIFLIGNDLKEKEMDILHLPQRKVLVLQLAVPGEGCDPFTDLCMNSNRKNPELCCWGIPSPLEI